MVHGNSENNNGDKIQTLNIEVRGTLKYFVSFSLLDGAANSVQLVSLIVIESIYDLVLVINIVFIVGIVFRQSQLLCCCFSASGSADAQRRGTGRFGQHVSDYTLQKVHDICRPSLHESLSPMCSQCRVRRYNTKWLCGKCATDPSYQSCIE